MNINEPKRKETPLPEGLKIRDRMEWMALGPKRDSIEKIRGAVPNVMVTLDTRTRPCDNELDCQLAVKDMQWRHMANDDADDIKYNFLVGGDNRVYEGRGWRLKPGITPQCPKNTGVINIGLIGRFPSYEHVPEDYKTLVDKCIEHGINNNYIKKDFKMQRVCPTDEELFGKLVEAPAYPGPREFPCY